MREKAQVREVGPRDGIQMVKTILTTEQKLKWVREEAAAGAKYFEATSFVPPKVIAQFADAPDVATGVLDIPGIEAAALVPNLKGAQRAFDIGCAKVNYVLSASEAHNQSNVRRSTDESLQGFRDIMAEHSARGLKGKVVIGAAIATSFGCTIQGHVSEKRVVEIAVELAKAGADEISLADTVGYGNPAQIRRLFTDVTKAVGKIPLAAHFHDTRGLGIANVSAAVEAGVRRFDASLAGLGGCPFAPGATGNIATEDCVFLLEELGFDTGIDIDKLIPLRKEVESWLPGERFFGMVARAGLPKTYRATQQAA
ncbi:hydroxymethylglutaryl-CoA lyase YngG [Variibacter gotjawalensis]|uniref:Hydroxymethylglutaryl-CoA lyase YngG n=1 Tax=Variibacter gotjawalensis TaxID=1333996 RepID=A0A0S3PUR0_9BRAD|nr:hydroxymethylglutaryl-CoA lyase [Variibacter gotjawalensis]NIK49960.1 hydroxymethylglutaryl-CoA lyase [Variibacter gotjawalensis]RZS45959.1 hydroxymethylglutaryl-CoA lyase [Variibacter gotjawalensis]BAT59634.1 hydroxymethylglutaryl-CoA lyase YngG [Variibacter gotjawalensis]